MRTGDIPHHQDIEGPDIQHYYSSDITDGSLLPSVEPVNAAMPWLNTSDPETDTYRAAYFDASGRTVDYIDDGGSLGIPGEGMPSAAEMHRRSETVGTGVLSMMTDDEIKARFHRGVAP